MNVRIARPLACAQRITVPFNDVRYRGARELPAYWGPSHPCTDEVHDGIDRHLDRSVEYGILVDLITGQSFKDTRTVSQRRALVQIDPILSPVHGLGTLLPHVDYDVLVWDRSGEAAAILAQATGREEAVIADAITARRALPLTSLEIHRAALVALQREESPAECASPINAAARLGHFSLR